jgi:hypothetical protein
MYLIHDQKTIVCYNVGRPNLFFIFSMYFEEISEFSSIFYYDIVPLFHKASKLPICNKQSSAIE